MQEYAKLNENNELIIQENVKILDVEKLKGVNPNLVEKVILPYSLEEIKDGVFKYFHSLKEVEFRGKVKKIGDDCFSHCWELEKINLPSGLEEVGERSFLQCPRIKSLVLPESLKLVKKDSFRACGLKEIQIPKNLTSIGLGSFFCKGLEKIKVDSENLAYSDLNSNVLFKKSTKEVVLGCSNSKLNEEVEVIGEKAFSYCYEISEMEFPKSLREIKYKAFSCSGLESIKLLKTIIKCEDNAFEHCQNLKSIQIEEGFNRISEEMFAYCDNVQIIEFPSQVEIGARAFLDCKLQYVRIPFDACLCSGNQDIINAKCFKVLFRDSEVSLKNIDRYSHSRNGMIFKLDNKQIVFADLDGNCINESENIVYAKANAQNEAYDVLRLVPEMWAWKDERFLPHIIIVEHMPLSDLKFFYKDNNPKNWFMILKEYGKLYPDIGISGIARETLFKMAYSLGVFCENGKQSAFAKKYIIENLLPIANNKSIQRMFIGYNTFENPYNQEFADFFVKHFDDKSIKNNKSIPYYLQGLEKRQRLLVTAVNEGKGIDENGANFFTLCYNNFNNFKRLYSTKKVNTRFIKERITPTLLASSFKKVSYEDVDIKAKELSEICALYGFNQEQYRKVQEWYLIGNNIKEKEKSIFVFEDEDLPMKYELLTKSSVIVPILGILTNCCQRLNDMGETCMEYGMTKPNSEFLKIELNGEMFGQCWLWYDDQHRQLTIDNIEVSKKMENKIKKDLNLQEDFKDCLNRFALNAFLAMRDKGIPVEKITMGLGHNFFKCFLIENYDLIEDPKQLNGYVGYKDSLKQVMLFDVKNLASKQDKLKKNKKSNERENTQ